jgi:hypothetical protein
MNFSRMPSSRLTIETYSTLHATSAEPDRPVAMM